MEKFFFKKLSYLVFSAMLSVPCAVNAEGPTNEEQLQAKAVMGNVYSSYTKIIPYIYATDLKYGQPKDKKEKAELLKNLTDLSDFFKAAKHADFFKRPGFRPSLETINGHLDETIISVQSDNMIFAQKRLNALGALCVSCHSQLPPSVAKNAFGANVVKEKRESFDNDLSYANYLYLVRRFDEARDYFEKSINAGLEGSSKYTHREILSALKSLISIDTKIQFNADKAHAFIKKWEKNPRLSVSDKKMIGRWKADLDTWKDFSPTAVKSIPEFIQKHLAKLDMKKELLFSGEDDVTLLISSGVLQNFLVENPESEHAPEILYWLSLAEHRMSSTYFFSLGDLYLKDCIIKYPSSPYAKKCYQEYADSIEAGYSGSAGTDIPPSEKRELMRLKSLLKK